MAFPAVQLGCSDAVGPVPPPQPIDYRDYPFTPGTLVQGTYGVSDITVTRTSLNLDPEQLEYTVELSKLYMYSPRTVTGTIPFDLEFFLSVTETIVNTKYDVTITQETMLKARGRRVKDSSPEMFTFTPTKMRYTERRNQPDDYFNYYTFDEGPFSGLTDDYDYFGAGSILLVYPYGATALIKLSQNFQEWGPVDEETMPSSRGLLWKIEGTLVLKPGKTAPSLTCRKVETYTNLHFYGGETCRF